MIDIQCRMRRLALLLPFVVAALSCSAQVDLSRLKLPQGFKINVFATAKGPRMMTWTPGGVLLVSDMESNDVIALPDRNHDGKADETVKVLTGLKLPHGLAFHDSKLYVAETNRTVRYDWNEQTLKATNPQVITRTPTGGHATRTILFAPNGKLYLSIGSSCNVCVEKDQRRATVLEMNADGAGERIFARGLRNAVGLTWNDKTSTIWTTDNGRDMLGDDLPPEEINDLGKNGGDFGWPYCYGNKLPNPEYKNAQRCASTIPPVVEMQAHSAPLGLAFNRGSQFPAEYKDDLFVAFHGSWNRSIPTGYKVVRIHWTNGKPQVEDFITGWLPPGAQSRDGLMGRPVGILFAQDGSMFVTDDEDGVIYRVTYGK
jgi:glucose/arabinose dehydrogenase